MDDLTQRGRNSRSQEFIEKSRPGTIGKTESLEVRDKFTQKGEKTMELSLALKLMFPDTIPVKDGLDSGAVNLYMYLGIAFTCLGILYLLKILFVGDSPKQYKETRPLPRREEVKRVPQTSYSVRVEPREDTVNGVYVPREMMTYLLKEQEARGREQEASNYRQKILLDLVVQLSSDQRDSLKLALRYNAQLMDDNRGHYYLKYSQLPEGKNTFALSPDEATYYSQLQKDQ